MNIAIVIAAWIFALANAFVFVKAGTFKLTSPISKLLEAGFGWVSKTPVFVVRLIALLELAGAAGLILVRIAQDFFHFDWAQPWGVAAGAGLALTMFVAAWVHISRGEFKYTWKNNVGLFAASAVAAVLFSLVNYAA